MTALELSVVVPLYNEAPGLEELHARLGVALETLSVTAEMLFVDDGSTDDSFERLLDLARRDPRVRALQLRRNYGKSPALAAGFARARGRLIVTLDADLQDDPAEIPRLLSKLDEGYDLVSGWKRERRDPVTRRLASRLFNGVTAALTGVRLHDINCGLKAYRREVTDSISLYGQLHRFLPVLAAREGFRLAEIEVQHAPRRHGRSKFGSSRLLAGALDLLTVLFLTRFVLRPLHLFGGAGVAIGAVGAAITGWLGARRILYHEYLSSRPLLLAGVLLTIVGAQLVSIGLIGEMITAGAASGKRTHVYGVRREAGFGPD
jgi:glycosyltransferase involved in cell wall biosynthesis